MPDVYKNTSIMRNWIPIRHDYVIDNFDNLLDSLSDADFSNSDDGILLESVLSLEEVSKGLLADYFSHKLGVSNQADDVFVRNVRIVLASIFSSWKLHRDVSIMILDLLDSLVINDAFKDEEFLSRIKDLSVSLAKGNGLEVLPYNLKDLVPEKFDFPLFKQKLIGFKCKNEHEDKAVFESSGSCLFDGDDIQIFPILYSRQSGSKFRPVIEASLNVKVMAESKKKLNDLDFKDQELFLNQLKQTFTPAESPNSKKLKNYSEGEEFFVKAKEIDPSRGIIKCLTIDPSYVPLELNLDLPRSLILNNQFSVSSEDFLNKIEPGQILKVQLINKVGRQYFSLYNTFRDFFTNAENFQDTYAAIFVTDYPGGTRWLTEMGHTVNIMKNDWDTEISDAASKDCSLAIEVSGINVKTDKKGNFVTNANRVGVIWEDEPEDNFRKEIPSNIIAYALECWAEDCPSYSTPEKPIKPIPAVYPRLVSHLLSRLAEDSSISFQERFYNAFCAKLLAFVTEDSHDEAYCDYVIAYLKAIWAFAQDPGHKWLSPTPVPVELEGVKSIERLSSIISILSEYKTEHHFAIPDLTKEVEASRLHNLVNASNSLSGNIPISEINRIKRTITQCLGIESLYVEEASDKFWFGEESDMLEFKSSVVFPPTKYGEKKADPDIQIWQILKTVNGFLNSLHGGTLLIGVNDFGNASGLEDDIQWLYLKGMLVAPEADKYLLFIKNRIDRAFEAYKRKDSDTDVTATRIRYSTEQKDCNTIVRVEVSPYEFGCVKIKENIALSPKSEIKRPVHIKEAYIRSGNTTEELTPAKKEKLESDKRTVIKDAEQQKQILVQEAIDTSKYLKIKNYQSYRGKSDKIIEPIELLPLRGLIVGIQKGEKDLRVFKLNRCESVELTNEKFKPSKPTYSVDPFNMLTVGKGNIRMQINLDRLGWLRILESFPYTANCIAEDNSDKDFPYKVDCNISDLKGIGSFCLSIPGHFKIIDCKGLEVYIKDQIKNFNFS